MTLQEIAQRHYLTQRALQASVVARMLRGWNQLDSADVAGSWQAGTGSALYMQLATAQLLSASLADEYVDQALAGQDQSLDRAGTVVARGFAGFASDGRSLESLLFEAVIATRAAFGAGLAPVDAMARGAASLTTIAQTQVADAGRTAVGAAITARPAVSGWVRMLSLPSCSRCAILAGRFYRWNSGFQRHPFCDCRHIPASENIAGDLTTDARAAVNAGHVTGLSKADHKAITEDGADPAKVINAHRGMYTADVFGRRVKATRSGPSFDRSPRLRPEAIYKHATDRDDAIRLLKRFGYLT